MSEKSNWVILRVLSVKPTWGQEEEVGLNPPSPAVKKAFLAFFKAFVGEEALVT